MSDFPKTLVHPGYAKSVIKAFKHGSATDYHGTPDRYPPVTVHNLDAEEYHRSLGYMLPGEAPHVAPFSEYPLMLSHPDHEDAVPEETGAEKQQDGSIKTFVKVHARPEKFPHAIVQSEVEEQQWLAKGYRRVGEYDPDAIRDSMTTPYVAGAGEKQEFPKMVGGTAEKPVIEDPDANKPTFQAYPQWAHGELYQSQAAHKAAHPEDFSEFPAAAADPKDAELSALRAKLAALESAPKKNKGGRPRKVKPDNHAAA